MVAASLACTNHDTRMPPISTTTPTFHFTENVETQVPSMLIDGDESVVGVTNMGIDQTVGKQFVEDENLDFEDSKAEMDSPMMEISSFSAFEETAYAQPSEIPSNNPRSILRTKSISTKPKGTPNNPRSILHTKSISTTPRESRLYMYPPEVKPALEKNAANSVPPRKESLSFYTPKASMAEISMEDNVREEMPKPVEAAIEKVGLKFGILGKCCSKCGIQKDATTPLRKVPKKHESRGVFFMNAIEIAEEFNMRLVRGNGLQERYVRAKFGGGIDGSDRGRSHRKDYIEKRVQLYICKDSRNCGVFSISQKAKESGAEKSETQARNDFGRGRRLGRIS